MGAYYREYKEGIAEIICDIMISPIQSGNALVNWTFKSSGKGIRLTQDPHLQNARLDVV